MHGRVREQLAEARRVARIKQLDLAHEIGYETHAQVSNYEGNRGDIPVEKAELWAAACGFEILLVPTGDMAGDPEGLVNLVKAIRDPAARQVLAALGRLVRKPHRYWMPLLEHIRVAELAAENDEIRESER